MPAWLILLIVWAVLGILLAIGMARWFRFLREP